MTYSVKGKTYWVVGASAGIGAALVKELDRRGASLVLSARSEVGLLEVAASLSRLPRIVPMDVTNPAEVARGISEMEDIDGVIYMAGDYTPMDVGTWDTNRAVSVSAVNYGGALNVMGALVPRFIDRAKGHFVIIGSLAGFSGLPGAIAYGDSKAALMHLARNMKADLKGSELRVQLINPGFVDTRLTQKNNFRMPFIMAPEKAAHIIADHMETARFSKSFPRLFSWYFKLRGILEIMRM
jgi:NADP-dependent 3-hydroxy acid dehydrogenase YdfG